MWEWKIKAKKVKKTGRRFLRAELCARLFRVRCWRPVSRLHSYPDTCSWIAAVYFDLWAIHVSFSICSFLVLWRRCSCNQKFQIFKFCFQSIDFGLVQESPPSLAGVFFVLFWLFWQEIAWMCFDFRPWLAWNCCFQQLEHECFVKEKKHLAFVYVRACVRVCTGVWRLLTWINWDSRGIVTLTTRILSTIVLFQYCCVTTPALTINR